MRIGISSSPKCYTDTKFGNIFGNHKGPLVNSVPWRGGTSVPVKGIPQSQLGEGTPVPAEGWRTPVLAGGYPCPRVHPCWDWGTPWMALGYHPTGTGVPPGQDWGTSNWDWGTPSSQYWGTPSDRSWDQRPGKEPGIGVCPKKDLGPETWT